MPAAVRQEDSPDYPGGEAEYSSLEDSIVGLDAVEPSPFLRGQKRVPVRRGPFQRGTANRLRALLLILAIGSRRCRSRHRSFTTTAKIPGDSGWIRAMPSRLSEPKNATRAQVLEVMGADIGRNVFFIPLDERKRQLEKIPWIESATVMRLLPNRMRIALRERTPVAFAKVGNRIELIDVNGVTMDDASGRQLFVSGHRGQHRIRTGLDPRGADEDLQWNLCASWIRRARITRANWMKWICRTPKMSRSASPISRARC